MMDRNPQTKIIVMTGGTSGLGAVAAAEIARAPGVRMILGARRPDQQTNDCLPLDLTRLESVRQFAAKVIAMVAGEGIGALVLNAGTAFADIAHRTDDGYETTFAVNHLAHYLLLRLLSPHLAPQAVVIITTSNTHDPRTNPVAPPHHADAEKLAHPDRYAASRRSRLDGPRAYSASKLCNLLTARAFAESDDAKNLSARVIAYNPGFTLNTGLMRNAPVVIRASAGLVVPILSPIFRINTLKTSGGNLAALALDKIEPPPSKIYASVVKRKLTWPEPSELARRDEVMERLWRDSARLTGLLGATDGS